MLFKIAYVFVFELRFGENEVSNSWDKVDIEFVWRWVVVIFCVKTNFDTLGWGGCGRGFDKIAGKLIKLHHVENYLYENIKLNFCRHQIIKSQSLQPCLYLNIKLNFCRHQIRKRQSATTISLFYPSHSASIVSSLTI